MISIEGPRPTKELRNEKVDKEKELSKSPESQESPESQIEVNKNLLEGYSEMIKDFIESQTEGVLSEAENRIKRSADNMNVSQELLSSSAEKFGLYNKLHAIQEEAENLANDIDRRISEVILGVPPEQRQELENSPWQEALETEIGKTYLAAMRGIIDGKKIHYCCGRI
jgi:hypothetical protein